MSNIKVTIVDANRLRLEQDATKGDIIDLREVNEVDTSILLRKIEQASDELYNKKLATAREDLKKEYNIKMNEEIHKIELKNQDLASKLDSQKKELDSQHRILLNEKISSYEKDIAQLNNNLDKTRRDVEHKYQIEITKLENQIKNISIEKENEYKDKLHKSSSHIENLKRELENTEKSLKQEKDIELAKIHASYKEQLYEKESQLSKLERSRADLNVKPLGEDLEKWCDNEFQSQALFGLDNISWEKDNLVVRGKGESQGTKADFIYKVYATDEKNENELLTSAILEMKSESPDSKVKQTNASFYKKLDSDRVKKNLEYAILVSELEWDTSNDIPIRKVNEYDKMFVVRPQYFMSFLSVITSLGMKYKELLLAHEEKRLEFRDLEDIINEFEDMKDSILNTTIKYIRDHMDNIMKQTENIKNANNRIIESSNVIIDTHIQTVINKIENFKIKRITEKIKEI